MDKSIEIIIDNKEYFALEKSQFIELYHSMQSAKHLNEVNNGTAKTTSIKEYIEDREKNMEKISYSIEIKDNVVEYNNSIAL